jgi:hypothetical protein
VHNRSQAALVNDTGPWHTKSMRNDWLVLVKGAPVCALDQAIVLVDVYGYRSGMA